MRRNKKRKNNRAKLCLALSVIVFAVVMIVVVIPNMHITGKGNAAVIIAEADVKPPVFSGVRDRSFSVGDKVIYLEGVLAVDEVDGEVDVYVDKSEVNVNTAGTYQVYYTAVDRSGNKAVETAMFSFTTADQTGDSDISYKELALQLVNDVTDGSMTMSQKLQAVYDYLYGRMYYGQSYDGKDWENEALQVLKRLTQESEKIHGDCFTSASLAKAVLEALGVQTKWLRNYGALTGITNHVWILCNAGTGWYHFDLTHFDTEVPHFMVTDSDLEEYMTLYDKHSYERDKSLYPATPEVPFME